MQPPLTFDLVISQASWTVFQQMNKHGGFPLWSHASLPRCLRQVLHQFLLGNRGHCNSNTGHGKCGSFHLGAWDHSANNKLCFTTPLPGEEVLLCPCSEELTSWAVFLVEVFCLLRICLQCRRPGFNPWVGKIPWSRKWQPTPVFSPGESHGWRSLACYSPWGHKMSDTTEQWAHFSTHRLCGLKVI